MPLQHTAKRFPIFLSIFIFIITIFISCSSQRGDTIIELTRQYYCERNQLAKTADSLWTKVSKGLESEIRDTNDVVMLRKMLSMHSAPMLKSFQIYNKLSDSLKVFIDEVEMKDKSLVNSMAAISFKIDSVEMLKLQYLSKVGTNSSKGKDFVRSYYESYNAPCKSTK